MFCSKVIMEALPNIHLLGALTVAYTAVFRKKALIIIYVYVLLNGLFAAFSLWWVPYLYIWTLLWGAVMLVPKRTPDALKAVIYCVLCCLHGLFFGTLYAPVWAIAQGLDFKGTLAWIIAGLGFDLLHFFGNLAASVLIIPLCRVLERVRNEIYR